MRVNQDWIDISFRIQLFADVLRACAFLHDERPGKDWDNILEENFAQASWELLVESVLGGRRLVEYTGADVYADSSRVSYPTDEATHVAVVTPKNDGVRDELTQHLIVVPPVGLRILEVWPSGIGTDFVPAVDMVRIQNHSKDADFLVSLTSVSCWARPIIEGDFD